MILVPTSIGELLDKISILMIKSEKTTNEFVHKELNHLISLAKEHDVYNDSDINDLLLINRELWHIEDSLRQCEKDNTFDEKFIDLARRVYINNDERCRIKREINERVNSEYREIKVYNNDK